LRINLFNFEKHEFLCIQISILLASYFILILYNEYTICIVHSARTHSQTDRQTDGQADRQTGR